MSRLFRRIRFFLYALAVLAPGFTGCSCQTENASMANPEAVYQAYGVTYDAASNKTNANARYRFGGFTGTNLKLDGAAKVVHNTVPMKETNPLNLGVHYVDQSDGFVAEHTFEYTDTTGKVLTNTVRLSAVEFAADFPPQISRAQGAAISFVGDALGANETIALVLEQPTPGQQTNTVNIPGTKQGPITITADTLKQFMDGEVTVRIQRQTTPALQQATSRGGAMSGTYIAAPRKVVIVK